MYCYCDKPSTHEKEPMRLCLACKGIIPTYRKTCQVTSCVCAKGEIASWVECRECFRLFHLKCLSLPGTTSQYTKQFSCSRCVPPAVTTKKRKAKEPTTTEGKESKR